MVTRNRPRLLFVEDERTVREHLAEQLSDEYDVETADEGEQALRAVLRRRPDLIITDLLMPTLDGVELVSLLRNTPSTSTIPILMVSGRAPDELRLKGFEFGADAFLGKPYTERELRVHIRSMLRTTEMRAAATSAEARQKIEHEALVERAALLESISDGFYALDRQWRFTYINRRALDYFKFPTRDTLIGRNLWDTVPASKSSRFEEEYRAVMKSRQPRNFEALSPYSQRWVEAYVYPTPQGIAVNFRDISDRKHSETALRNLTTTLESRVEAAIAERDRAWNHTQDMLAVIGKDGFFRAVNPSWTRILGWQPEEVVGQDYLALVVAEDHVAAQAAFAHASERPLRQFETRFVYKTGGYRVISWVAAPQGDFIYASGRDVTSERAAIDALRRAEARTRTIFETSYQYQGYVDMNGMLVDANRTSLASIRGELDQVIGHKLWETPWFQSTPGAAEALAADFARVQERGETIRKELVLDLPIGRRTLDFSMRLAFDSAGSATGVVYEAMDITEQKHNAEQLAHMQKLETIGQLTGSVAHDFNNLLTPIVGALDVVHRKYSPDERSKRLTSGALQSAERARLLVQRLLAFARKQHLEARAVDIKELIENLFDLLSRSIGSRIEIEIDVQPALPPAKVDPNQLELALLNLALNARDAMPDGGKLKITAYFDNQSRDCIPSECVAIAVTDTGQGMDAQTLACAIEPFFTTKPSGQGTGLGLSMVHGLAAQSGGALLLSSVPGVGTTATLRLPIADERPISLQEPSIAEVVVDQSVTLLVVDDEDLVRSSTARMLEDAGYKVLEAESGAQALELLSDNPQIAAVISDYAMPGMTGVQLARTIQDRTPQLPVLIVSGFTDLPGAEADGMPLLAKPFRQIDLVTRIAELWAGKST